MNAETLTDAQYVLDLCGRIAAHTDVPGTITRTFLSPATHAVHDLLRGEMQLLGMCVRVDAVGNLRGLYPGATDSPSILLMGSHIDTVPDAGAYDGVLGVALALALLHRLEGRRLAYAIEVIAFSEEEGIRFQLPFIGSRALVGELQTKQLALRDAGGVTLKQAIAGFGLDGGQIADAVLTPHTFAFIEMHIEQGPVLEEADLALGVVSRIVGQTRYRLTFTGQANHAGTTPMHLRRDALAAAAEWIGRVERFARGMRGLVATVGTIEALPGAANVIAGTAAVSLDVRHGSDEQRGRAVKALLDAAQEVAGSRGLGLEAMETSRQEATAMHPKLRARLACAMMANGNVAHEMESGAGHDAMILACRIPSAMLFVRTPRGVSHHPSEAVLIEDLDAALRVGSHLLNTLDPNEFASQPS